MSEMDFLTVATISLIFSSTEAPSGQKEIIINGSVFTGEFKGTQSPGAHAH